MNKHEFEIRPLADDDLEGVAGGMMKEISLAPNPDHQPNGSTAGVAGKPGEAIFGAIVIGVLAALTV